MNLLGKLMSKIKVSELFYSIQGEGRYQGVPSVFLRTFGCNFTCDGFGMPHGEKSQERHNIVVDNYKTYNELPLVRSGCDSYASWMSEFKHLSPMRDTNELADDIMNLLPYKEWRKEHLVITGGEPLLGWQRAYPDLLDKQLMANLKEITFETNGTQKLSSEFKDYLIRWTNSNGRMGHGNITFSVSAKLSCSGEERSEAIKPEIVCEYEEVGHTYLKFVVSTEDDVWEAVEVTDAYRAAGFKGPVYLMAQGGTVETHTINTRHVAELAMQLGLRYSARLQIDLFRNAWGT